MSVDGDSSLPFVCGKPVYNILNVKPLCQKHTTTDTEVH